MSKTPKEIEQDNKDDEFARKLGEAVVDNLRNINSQ